MPRLTKADIEQRLLAGHSVSWQDVNNKQVSIELDTAIQRRLFAFLLKSNVREPKNLPTDFVSELAAAYGATDDPANTDLSTTAGGAIGGPWKIQMIKVEGFGGVNAWKGKPLEFALDSESLLVEGPNGSGKSSLTAAIIWGLTGERPRDQEDSAPEDAQPVFNNDDKEVGKWPPVATYPTDILGLNGKPSVSVEITFSDPNGAQAVAKRTFDGEKINATFDPALRIPSLLLETGLSMPARLPQLRFERGRTRLTDAVQLLTGLDDLRAIGLLAQGLCHASREYRSYKTNELRSATNEFNRQMDIARTALSPTSVAFPNFGPSDTSDPAGAMATFGKSLQDKASDLTKVVSEDLADGLDLSDPHTQRQISLELANAVQDVNGGLSSLEIWKTLEKVSSILEPETRSNLRSSVADSQKDLEAAIAYFEKEQADNRYRLKAVAAQWHEEHGEPGAITECPTCTQSLEELPELQEELNALRLAGEAATRKLADNLNAISTELESAVPQALRRFLSDPLSETPKADLLSQIRAKYISHARYKNYLTKCAVLVETACIGIPPTELSADSQKDPRLPETAALEKRMAITESMCRLAEWFEEDKEPLETWWDDLSSGQPPSDGSTPTAGTESLLTHLSRLENALGEAEPYRLAAEAMRKAWTEGRAADAIEKERALREKISDSLAPLKNLDKFSEAQARIAINELSDRISRIHQQIYITDTLQFQKAELERRSGLTVRGELSDSVRIDATLVANTSWLRGVLWAFIFALREEGVEQLGDDPFPVLVLDDPQQTFDSEHRHRWAEQIAKLQKGSPNVQVIMTTHEEQLLSFLKFDGVTGRHALIYSAGPELGHIGLFEGDALDRKWSIVRELKTPQAAREYMADLRVFVEGMLKLMLRGEDVNISGTVIGSCREKISELGPVLN